jgi:hypothetical protein
MPHEEKIPFKTQIALIRRPLKAAIEDLKAIELNETKKLAIKTYIMMIKAALGDAGHHLRKLEESLDQ